MCHWIKDTPNWVGKAGFCIVVHISKTNHNHMLPDHPIFHISVFLAFFDLQKYGIITINGVVPHGPVNITYL